MDEFLKIIYRNYAEEQGLCEKYFKDFVKEPLDISKKYLNSDLSEDIENAMMDSFCETAEIFFVEGMKLAIEIMEKKYVPII